LKFVDEYRSRRLIDALIREISQCTERVYTWMEVCGGHTMAIHRFGIPALLPENIRLLSGPGCPVCVTHIQFIDKAIAYARMKKVIVASFGDLLRVPGSYSSLEKERAQGHEVRIVYSLLDALEIARNNPTREVVFLGIGFETTAPGSAVGIMEADRRQIHNFSLLSAHKLMPPAMDAIVEEGVALDGYICPGHVSTITGASIYRHIPEKYGLACVISGFEPVDMLQSILMLIRQVEEKNPSVEIQYKRAVHKGGNPRAREYMNQVFEKRADYWRGLGIIQASGLGIRREFRRFDAEYKIPVETKTTEEHTACICGEILKGLQKPTDCKLFDNFCTPSNPVGACMVSPEGTCQAYFRYKQYV